MTGFEQHWLGKKEQRGEVWGHDVKRYRAARTEPTSLGGGRRERKGWPAQTWEVSDKGSQFIIFSCPQQQITSSWLKLGEYYPSHSLFQQTWHKLQNQPSSHYPTWRTCGLRHFEPLTHLSGGMMNKGNSFVFRTTGLSSLRLFRQFHHYSLTYSVPSCSPSIYLSLSTTHTMYNEHTHSHTSCQKSQDTLLPLLLRW